MATGKKADRMMAFRRRLRGALCVALWCGVFGVTVAATHRAAWGQMSIGSTTGVLPPTTPTASLILGDRLNVLASQWMTPTGADQTLWKANIESRANQSPSGAPPTDFTTSARDASIAQAAALRYAMTGNAADLQKAVDILLVLDLKQGTFITRPEVLTSYLSAYDFIRGAPLSDLPAATRATIESRLLAKAQGLGNGNGTYSNARAKVGATRALAGVMLRDQALLDEGLSDLQGHFDYSTTDDGWFTDSQGHYLSYTLRHVALFARAYQQGSGVDLYENLRPYVDMSIGLRLPDGTMPNVSNGLVRAVPLPLLSAGAPSDMQSDIAWYRDNLSPVPYPWLGATNALNNDGTYSTFFALTDFDTPTPADPGRSPTFLSEGQSHVSVFRQNWSATSDYLAISAGIDSPAVEFHEPPIDLVIPAFHSHNDTGEILLAARGKYILVAPGYDRDDLSNSPAGFQPQRPEWHNVVLVDGDLGADSQGRRMRPEDFVHTNRLDATERGDYRGTSDFSTLTMQYRETEVRRSMAFASEDYFVVSDRMLSDAVHDYGFNLVGRGTQTVLLNTPEEMQVRWEYDGAQVIEHLFATAPMSLSTDSLWMHVTFNQFEPTQRMTATMSAEDGLFLSVLETGTAGSGSMLDITQLATASDLLAVEVEHLVEGWIDTILTQSAATTRTVGRLTSDATYAYARWNGAALEGAMLSEGTLLVWDGAEVLESSDPLTISLALDNAETIAATVSADGLMPDTELRFFGRGAIVAAMLDGSPLAFANYGAYGSVWLEGGGSLVVEFAAVPEPSAIVLLATGQLALVVWQVRRNRKRRPATQ